MDTLTPEQRSERMSRVKAKGSAAERHVRSLVFRLGYRFRLHGAHLPGKPDLVFAGRRKVIFVHGCFWHRHPDPNCRLARLHYRVVTRVLNAANYGVPQRRERVLFVGFRDDLDLEWSFPIETHSAEALLWDQFRDGSYWEKYRVAKALRPTNELAEARAASLDVR